MATGKVQVAVIGTGDVGRGWAAMCVAAGWPVSLFDPNSSFLPFSQYGILAVSRCCNKQ